MIARQLTATLTEKLFSNKVIMLIGARQVGKTTLVRDLIKNQNPKDILWLNGDELDVQNMFSEMSSTRFRAFLGNKRIIVIDEAQRIHDIGLRLKLIVDTYPEYQLIVTGSSSFELTNKLNEPLTGRKWEYKIYPLSFAEMVEDHGILEEKRLLPHRLIYGYYPEIVTNIGDEEETLKNLSTSYLYKDILLLDQIKKPENLIKLLQALAYQIGSQVSYAELGQLSQLDGKTVEKYLQILEDTYIIFRLGSFSRNLRNELKFSRKIYFYDTGIRNALIANFSQIENRTDTGMLWENFIISERIKFLEYNKLWSNKWFWRTVQQKEIDYIEERDGQLSAYEFKWNPTKNIRQPKVFLGAYPDASFKVIHRDNIEDFLLFEE
ncbi:MAG: ATP-binding protein [Bacteroidia bacterium]|nr:ATP-binding protein [Bacteroidia bacterium]